MSTINNSVNNKCEAGITVTGGTVNLGNDGSAVNIGTTTGSTIVIGQKTNGSGSTTIEGYSHVAGANGITLLDNEGNTLYTTVSGLYMNDSSGDTISLSGGITLNSVAGVNLTSASSGILLNADSAGILTANVYGVTPVGGTNETVTVNSVTGQLGSTAGGGGGITTIDGTSGSATGSTVTISGGSSGAVFTASGSTVTESFNYLALPTTTATNGLVSINGSAFMHNMNGGTFLGVGAGNLTSIPGTITAIGAGAASINTSSDGHIVAIGDSAMGANTAGGFGVYIGTNAGYYPTGDFCTAVGYGALSGNASNAGGYNTAIGQEAMNISYGSYGTALGWQAGQYITSGAGNTLLGADAGVNYTSSESWNINIGSRGVNAESNVLRIADGTGSGSQQLVAAYISGITGVVVTGAAAIISSGNQLGVLASSKQFKDDVQDMGDDSSDILKLRPVTFVWNKNSSPGLKDATDERQFGFIAEEAAEIMPSLIHYDANGKPFSFKYNDMPAILLNELQKALKRIEALEAKVSSYECKG